MAPACGMHSFEMFQRLNRGLAGLRLAEHIWACLKWSLFWGLWLSKAGEVQGWYKDKEINKYMYIYVYVYLQYS